MAEFQEVTKLLRRMCISMDGNDPYQKCEKCPLGEENICSLEISNIQDDELHRVEEKVMAWAAEHPEPVYPTWAQYFNKIIISNGRKPLLTDTDLLKVVCTSIPADIAQKLGIEPEEG